MKEWTYVYIYGTSIISVSFDKVSGAIKPYSSCTFFHISLADVNADFRRLRLSSCQNSSIGFKSVLSGGQSITSKDLSASNFFKFFSTV